MKTNVFKSLLRYTLLFAFKQLPGENGWPQKPICTGESLNMARCVEKASRSDKNTVQ